MKLEYDALLRGRAALISGGGSDVGRAVAKLFASHGAKVAIWDACADAVEASLAALRADAPDIVGFSGALSYEREVNDLYVKVKAVIGPVGVLVNAAGLFIPGSAEEVSDEDFLKMLEANVLCAVRLTKAALPDMIAIYRGDIVNITSDLGAFKSRSGAAAIAACGGALDAFSRCVALDYIRYHVRANCVTYPFDKLPGRKPLVGEPTPEDAANAALWYACDLSRFVVGDTVPVDGGLQYFAHAQGGAYL